MMIYLDYTGILQSKDDLFIYSDFKIMYFHTFGYEFLDISHSTI